MFICWILFCLKRALTDEGPLFLAFRAVVCSSAIVANFFDRRPANFAGFLGSTVDIEVGDEATE